MNVQVMGTCRIVESYDEASDRIEAECIEHGHSWSGSPWKVADKIDDHYDEYNPRKDWP